MSIRLHYEIERIKHQILSLSTVIETQVELAVKSVDKKGDRLANEVIQYDLNIDHMEVDLEEECFKLLALYQPVARDLRYIISVLKINTELARIGDIAVNIAERAIFLSKKKRKNILYDFSQMSLKSQEMLKESLKSFINLDEALAMKVIADDDIVDNYNRDVYKIVKKTIHEDTKNIEHIIITLDISRLLERIADHATSIAENVIYMIKGEIIRHRTEDFQFLLDKSQHNAE